MPSAVAVGTGTPGCPGFLSKHSASNVLMWTRQIYMGSNMGMEEVALGVGGAVYYSARFTINDGGVNDGMTDIALFEFDSDGNTVWSDTIGTAQNDEPQAMTIDSSGNIYVAGRTRGDFTDPTVTHTKQKAFVVKAHRVAGAMVIDWSSHFGTGVTTDDWVDDVALAPSGSVLVSGMTMGIMTGSGAAAPSTGWAAFVSSIDVTGTHTWSRQWTVANGSEANSVAVDATGNVYAAGYSGSDLFYPSQKLMNADGWIARLNPANGSETWKKMFGTPSAEVIYGMGVMADGNLVVGGSTKDSMTGVEVTGKYNAFAISYTTAGSRRWTTEAIATTHDMYVWSVATDPRGGAVLVGETNSNFGAANRDNTLGSSDNWYLRVGANGSLPTKHS